MRKRIGSTCRTERGGRGAFTLIEILVVVGIISLIAGMIAMLLPDLEDDMKVKETKVRMALIQSSLEIYRDRMQFYPAGSWKDSDPADSWSNQLGLKLGQDNDKKERDDMLDKAETAAQDAVNAIVDDPADPDVNFYRGDVGAQVIDRLWDDSTQDRDEQFYLSPLYGMWEDAYMRTYFSVIRGETYVKTFETGDIPEKALMEDSAGNERAVILDAWGNPFVYVSKDVPPVPLRRRKEPVHTPVGNGKTYEKLKTHNSITYAGNTYERNDQFKLIKEYGKPRGGRSVPDVDANGDGEINDEDAEELDIRIYAPQGETGMYELWSAGPDGKFNAIRSHPDNDDNIGIQAGEKF